MHLGLGRDVGTLTNEAFRLRCAMTQCKAFGVSWTFQTKTKSEPGWETNLPFWSIIRLAIRYRVPITIENPLTSRLWISPPIAKEVSRATSVITFDACQYGIHPGKRVLSWLRGTSATVLLKSAVTRLPTAVLLLVSPM